MTTADVVEDPHGVRYGYVWSRGRPQSLEYEEVWTTLCGVVFYDESESPEWRNKYKAPMTCVACVARDVRDEQDERW